LLVSESSVAAHLLAAAFLRSKDLLQELFSCYFAYVCKRANPRLYQVHDISIAHTNAIGKSPCTENDLGGIG
jgi:hypothetical protein